MAPVRCRAASWSIARCSPTHRRGRSPRQIVARMRPSPTRSSRFCSVRPAPLAGAERGRRGHAPSSLPMAPTRRAENGVRGRQPSGVDHRLDRHLRRLAREQLLRDATGNTWKPECTAAMTSGTSDMPTRSTPAWRRNRYSARVGMLGPATAANTPGRHGMPSRIATSRATSRHSRAEGSLMSTKRGPTCSSFSPTSGCMPPVDVARHGDRAGSICWLKLRRTRQISRSLPSARSTRTGSAGWPQKDLRLASGDRRRPPRRPRAGRCAAASAAGRRAGRRAGSPCPELV